MCICYKNLTSRSLQAFLLFQNAFNINNHYYTKKNGKNLYLKSINPYTKNTTFSSEAEQDFRHILMRNVFFCCSICVEDSNNEREVFLQGLFIIFFWRNFFLISFKTKKKHSYFLFSNAFTTVTGNFKFHQNNPLFFVKGAGRGILSDMDWCIHEAVPIPVPLTFDATTFIKKNSCK